MRAHRTGELPPCPWPRQHEPEVRNELKSCCLNSSFTPDLQYSFHSRDKKKPTTSAFPSIARMDETLNPPTRPLSTFLGSSSTVHIRCPSHLPHTSHVRTAEANMATTFFLSFPLFQAHPFHRLIPPEWPGSSRPRCHVAAAARRATPAPLRRPAVAGRWQKRGQRGLCVLSM